MAEILRFRNARGDLVEVESVPATRLKNEPGAIIEKVLTGGAVAITRHDAPKAVLISYDDFRSLAQAREPSLGALAGVAAYVRPLRASFSPGASTPVIGALPDFTIEPMAFSTMLARPPFLLPGVVFALRSTEPRAR